MKPFMPSNTDVLLSIMGLTMIFIKDYFDEYLPNNLAIFNNSKALIRWGAYVVIFVLIMLTGVMGADQFIYVNF